MKDAQPSSDAAKIAADQPRPWYRLHLATWLVASVIILAALWPNLIGWNQRGDRMYGWPKPRQPAPPPPSRRIWKRTENEPYMKPWRVRYAIWRRTWNGPSA